MGVICPTCGKVGTTLARDWDGETVAFECLPDLVTWAAGCSSSGRVSPFGGAAKLPWNLDWAAQWSLFGVTIEPCGKDLATAGGSRDRSDAIAREVFEREPPLNFPYEFLNIGGKKMSTSKGHGAAAHTITTVVPPEQLRFLFVRQRPETALEFDPEGTDAIPRLFDEFDRLAAATAGREVKGELPAGHESIFRYSLLDPAADVGAAADAFRPGLRPPRAAGPGPGRGRAARVEAEKGSPDGGRDRRAGRAPRGRPRLAGLLRARSGPGSRSAATPCRPRPSSCDPSSAGYLAPWRRSPTATRPRRASSGRPRSSPSPPSTASMPRPPSTPCTSRSSAAPTARARWLLASLDHDFVIGRLRAAGAAGEAQA